MGFKVWGWRWLGVVRLFFRRKECKGVGNLLIMKTEDWEQGQSWGKCKATGERKIKERKEEKTGELKEAKNREQKTRNLGWGQCCYPGPGLLNDLSPHSMKISCNTILWQPTSIPSDISVGNSRWPLLLLLGMFSEITLNLLLLLFKSFPVFHLLRTAVGLHLCITILFDF